MGEPDRSPSFAVDAMLGRLARLLRMLGFDAVYRPDIADAELKALAAREGRTILTRDTGIAAARLPVRVVLVRSDDPRDQLRQVIEELGLPTDGPLFRRCLLCNAEVVEVPRGDVEGCVPPYVFATQARFVRCPGCGKIYWPATHVARARRWLDGALKTRGSRLDGG